MPPTTSLVQRPISEQIEELKAKINLIEGDRKAYYESSQYAIKKNRERVLTLRKETAELRKRLSDRLKQDEHVIKRAFHDRPVERAALSNKTGPEAVSVFDNKVSDQIKKLNALRHHTACKQKQLEALQTQHSQMVADASDAVSMEKGESTEAKEMRMLENSYDKVRMKREEAKQVQRVYLDIKSRFETEALTYPAKLNAIEAEIIRTRQELKELEATKNDAELSKEFSQKEYKNIEIAMYSERKKREIELQKMKKEAEEKKIQHETIQKRLAQRGSIQHDEILGQEKQALMGEDHHQQITSWEQAFRVIKEATGVSDTMEVAHRFENQEETTIHLEELKRDNEKQIIRLREEKEKLQQDFEEMKYSGEAKLSAGQALLEEFQNHLAEEEERRNISEAKLLRSSKILVQVKAGVEHLAEKLHHLKTSKGHVPATQIPPTSDEHILDQLSTCEEKLLKLLEDLDGKDLSQLLKQMEEEEFHSAIESKVPMHNTRIKLPATRKDLVTDDDEDSGDDDVDVPTRVNIKKQSQFLIDSKTKRRAVKKKKKAK